MSSINKKLKSHKIIKKQTLQNKIIKDKNLYIPTQTQPYRYHSRHRKLFILK